MLKVALGAIFGKLTRFYPCPKSSKQWFTSCFAITITSSRFRKMACSRAFRVQLTPKTTLQERQTAHSVTELLRLPQTNAVTIASEWLKDSMNVTNNLASVRR